MAILELKPAYFTPPQRLLVEAVEENVGQHLLPMITPTMQPKIEATPKNDTEATPIYEKEVTQGWLLDPLVTGTLREHLPLKNKRSKALQKDLQQQERE